MDPNWILQVAVLKWNDFQIKFLKLLYVNFLMLQINTYFVNSVTASRLLIILKP